ncbi:MAG: Rieske 2Fe-2S domain-containing protein [Acidobacteria bacterium]|nr:Rieske 2Fe-2S domain-containing protein [Acidobacteriota bacterium]
MPGEPVDASLAKASTIPAEWYTDPAILRREEERVFGTTWQLTGLTSKVASPGSYFTATIAREPTVVVRDGEATLRAFSNVCRHRAGPVARGEGCRRSFQCGYHGWTWGLDGRLLNTPEFEGVEEFDRASIRLPRFRASTWGPLVFVNLDGSAEPLEDWLSDVAGRTAGVDMASMVPVERREYTVECNWKVYVDNYLEGYHIPVVHPSLYREIDYAAYRTEVYRASSRQIAPLRRSGDLARRFASSGEPGDTALYFWIFPNLMINVYPDNFSTNLILPVGPDRTRTVFEWFFREPDAVATREALRRTVEFSDEIQQEDIGICEAVQRGLASQRYARGRFSVRREAGVHHFHRLLAGCLQGTVGG